MRRAFSDAGIRLVDMWHRVMAVTVDQGIGWQQRRPPLLKAVVIILFAILWMTIGYVVSGVAGKLLARRDRRLN